MQQNAAVPDDHIGTAMNQGEDLPVLTAFLLIGSKVGNRIGEGRPKCLSHVGFLLFACRRLWQAQQATTGAVANIEDRRIEVVVSTLDGATPP